MSNLTILKTAIRTFENLYSLNDLHIASGAEAKHQPSLFIRLDATQELISEIQKETDKENILQSFRSGVNRGTYACEELVIAYAMWISPKFHLIVLRAFLAMHRNQPQQKTTVDDRTGLRNAVSFLVNKKGLIYSEVYQLIHQQFGVEHIDELSQEQLSQAIKYIHFLTLNLDGLFKKGEEVIIPEYIFDAIMKHAKLAQKLAEKVICYQEKQFALLGIARHYRSNELTSRANSLLSEFSYFLHEGEKLLAQQIENPSLTQIKKISFNA
ncbi:KilA-N domain-containing protein [Haemophilus influenzae]|uniref:KilA-N domain-containing protein n=1 Tax=Haemophilus influenzae TaxID=727 RepID=UPI00076659A8|nr:KilA-N domain-containing protein [Haemophilus influenzae]PRI35100.1 KilA-N domain protein [Haemophilus influenzae]PRI39281.1 KilA-N domain protein [Haemophilus influenzae]PRJ05947.1 KilA-N domain protein [Haemophilus influenzae]PRJ52347.1 KilA-N domain protein [Haemophilus influenzae]PRJ99711.1 KilA-N domain protein [Haemophilus influenzae]